MVDRSLIYRPARIDDSDAIAALLEPYAQARIVLRRTAEEIGSLIGNFIVADCAGTVVGAVALRDFGDGLEEVRSLVVRDDCAGKGIGSELVHAALALGRRRGARRVFALTLRPALFQRLGFALVSMELFPQKVWSDCARCPKRDACDEVAVMLELEAEQSAPAAGDAAAAGAN